ncbi:ribosome-associated translation inhibitor RaiA [Mariprofundus erugo]|uniref:Ribosome hibernation promoting factor n=1 Tax=Mariprofundus erugo TaxID=2528639 RepID=A0A5R9H0H0_9PROT|nr:ribosome-associated translation inhibitor RaiA [Mariprofundus erugo]TLS68534.1 ribosome-associated translation inhibitor RaiA [Mariprofundus erugo]TLS76892.1 ribosome-associated translation inhibitor RaiA [Mariprofundus erugo]
MQVSITGRHVELSEPLKAYVTDKLQHLKHSFDHVMDVHVVLSVEKFRQRCEVTMQAHGINIHGSDETEDMYASIDGVVDKLNRQLKRYRSKLHRHQSGGQREGRLIKVSHRILDVAAEREELSEDHQPATLRHETIDAKPMSVDEAVMQLELGSRDLLFFTNGQTEQLNAVYRRPDGTLSWIEPESV